MFRIARLSQWPQRPSHLLSLPEQGYTADDCLDFDLAIVEFWEWFQARQDEERPVKVKSPPNPGRGMQWSHQRKYGSVQAIFDLYYATNDASEMDPDVAAIDLGELMDAFDAFDVEMEA